MKKFLLSIFLVTLLFPAISSAAGYTTVTATVKDPNGLAYVNCAFNVSFLNQSTAPVQPLLNGSPFQQVYSGQSCDNTGAFTIVLPDNNVITPTPSKWTFSVCASDGKTCFSTSITITGGTQSITSTLQAAAVVLPFSLQTIGGTGASGQVAFWTGANSLSGDNGLFWDNVGKKLSIVATAGGPKLEVYSSSGSNYIRSNALNGSDTGYTIANAGTDQIYLYRPGSSIGFENDFRIWQFGSDRLTIKNGNVGIGTISPSNIISLGGQANQTFWMERQLIAATPGNSLTVQASGAVVGGTNLAGGALNLSGGTSTGTGTSVINFNTSSAGASGTADNAPTTKESIDGVGNFFPATAGTMSLGKSNLPFTTLFWSGSSSTPGTNNFTFAGTATAARTWTFQDASDTIVGRATTDTLTNKTLTNPVLNGTSITGVPASANLTATIASGTATMTTAAIAAGACGTTVTVVAASVATTDTITWAFNAAPAGTNAGVVAWPTAGNVNFAYCPGVAETPAAATLNWRVVR